MTDSARLASLPAIALVAAAIGVAAPLLAGDSTPPEDLVRLERLVGLRVAHVRDEGPVGSEQRKLYLEAQQDDAKGEQAIQARDYDKATSYFQHASSLLDRLGK